MGTWQGLLAGPALAVAAAGSALAQDGAAPAPLWELRLGGMALYAPDYPASEEAHWKGVGAPLFIYRGERLRIGAEDPNAVARAIVKETRRFEIDLSVDAHFGADSETDAARRGMPDLDARVEIGPQLTVNLADTGWSDAAGRTRLALLLPVRHVGATDLASYDALGAVVQPTLAYRKVWPGRRAERVVAYLGATWASEGVQDYYFEVAEPWVTPDRPAFDAHAGYLGAHAQASWVREMLPGLTFYLTYRISDYAGAENRESPLHSADVNHAASLSVVWTALRSKRGARDLDRQ